MPPSKPFTAMSQTVQGDWSAAQSSAQAAMNKDL
jgi:hypothetical protein